MNWNAVVGAKGRLKLEINMFTGRDGVERTNNQVKTFYAYDELVGQQPQQNYQHQQQTYQQPPQQSYQQPPQQQPPFPTTGQQGGNWSTGQF